MSLKISFRNDLYRTSSIMDENLERIRSGLEENPLFSDIYVIVPAGNPKDMIEFFHSRQLAQPYYQEREIDVIGIASTYSEAVLLVRQIVQECLDRRGDCALREYLLC